MPVTNRAQVVLPVARRVAVAEEEGEIMGAADKARNLGEKLKGKSKEAAGRLTDDERLEAEGKAEETQADAKQAAEKVKDTFKQD
jgi:uncharacterized protein YjbJ (UPF0337 family)